MSNAGVVAPSPADVKRPSSGTYSPTTEGERSDSVPGTAPTPSPATGAGSQDIAKPTSWLVRSYHRYKTVVKWIQRLSLFGLLITAIEKAPVLKAFYDSFAADEATINSTITSLSTMDEAHRLALLSSVESALSWKRRLIPTGRKTLIAFVKRERWAGASAEPCPSMLAIPESVRRALTIATREYPRRLIDFKPLEMGTAELLSLDSTNLEGAALVSADLRRITFVRTCLRQANLFHARLGRAHFGGAILNHAVLDSITASDSADFSGTQLDGASFIGATLRRSRFIQARGRGTLFIRAHLDRAKFDGAVLGAASFRDADIPCATFPGATLGADFDAARAQWAFFGSAVLTDAQRWEKIQAGSLAHAFIATAVLDSALKTWSYAQGADRSDDSDEWTTRKFDTLRRDSIALSRNSHVTLPVASCLSSVSGSARP